MQLVEIDKQCSQAFLEAPVRLSVDEEIQLHQNTSFTNSRGTVLYYDIHTSLSNVGIAGFYNRIGNIASMSYELYDPETWGQKIAPRSATYLRDMGFDTLGLQFIKLFIAKSNVRSRAVATRLGANITDTTPDSRYETWTITKEVTF